jgi:hypothetical protein
MPTDVVLKNNGLYHSIKGSVYNVKFIKFIAVKIYAEIDELRMV